MVDAPYKVAAENIYFVGYNGNGDVRCQWLIPIEESVPMGLSLVDTNLPQAVELPPAPVMLKKKLTGTGEKNED